MAFKRRRAVGRRIRGRTLKRRRVVRRRRVFRGGPRAQSFLRRTWKENWAFSNASVAGYWRVFTPTFSDLNNAAEYTNLYDLYKVNAVKVTFTPRWDAAEAGTVAAPGVNVPYLSWYTDPFSYTGPSGLYGSATYNSFLELANGRVKTRQMTKPISVYWKPRILDTSAVSNQFPRCPWLSTSNVIQPMRQLFAFMHDTNFAGAIAGWSVDVTYTFYFQTKASR